MKYLTIFTLIFSFNLFAQDKEADLQLPVTDLSQIERQEEEVPPTLDQVEMKQKETSSSEIRSNGIRPQKVGSGARSKDKAPL